MELTDDNSKTYKLWAKSELRFSVPEDCRVQLELICGSADIFGYEVIRNKIYTFPSHTSVSLFSWKGCEAKLWGRTENLCLTSNTTILEHLKLHALLEEMRVSAESKCERGPVCLVVGPRQSGKTSLCRLLLNYAFRKGWRPLFVDMNVRHSTLTLPGMFSILPVESQLDLTSAPDPHALTILNYGSTCPGSKMPLYFHLIKAMGELSLSRLENAAPKVRNAGMVIDTCCWIRRKGYFSQTMTAYGFQVDVVFVVGDEALLSEFQKDMPSSVKVVYVPVGNGVVQRPHLLWKRVWEYFYGTHEVPRHPHQFEVKFSDVVIYRPKVRNKDIVIHNTFKVSHEDVELVPEPASRALVNRVLCLSDVSAFNKNLLTTSMKGFVLVLEVDKTKETLTVLSRQPAPLPNKILVLTSAIRVPKNRNKCFSNGSFP